MKIHKILKVAVLTLLFTFPAISHADDLGDGNGNGDVQDIPTAPISDYIPLLALGALALGYNKSRKRFEV